MTALVESVERRIRIWTAAVDCIVLPVEELEATLQLDNRAIRRQIFFLLHL